MIKKTGLVSLFFLLCLGSSWAAKTSRIVSLAPSLTESVFLLGAGEQLVGCTTYCKKPDEAQNREKIGTLIQFNLEKILLLKPDLVVAMEFADRKAIEKLKKLGVPVELFPSPRNFDQLCDSFLQLGRLLGREERAEEVVAGARSRVAAVRQQTAGLKPVKIFWQLGAKPLFTATPGYFTNDYIEYGGGVNIAAHAKSGIYSREEVLKRNPDVIVIVTMGVVAEQEKRNWNHYRSIKAVQEGKVFVLDSYAYCSPTPAGFARALEELVALIHPAPKFEKLPGSPKIK